MLTRLRGLLGGRRRPPKPLFDAPLVIDRPTYAVGDVHGRYDLLVELLDMIAEDAAARGFDAPRIVLMGDYIDRGEQARETLAFVTELLAEEGGV